VFGVPTFTATGANGEPVLVWGQDRLAILARALGGEARDPIEPTTAPGTGMRVRFFHDFSSPFSYLASTRIAPLCAAAGVQLEPVPILLGALFRNIGTPDVPLFEMHAAKQAWVRRDLDDWAACWGVPLRFRTEFPVRTVLPLRVACIEPRATAPIYRAAWVDDRAIDRPDVLADVLHDAGLPAADLLARAESADTKQMLRTNTDEAAAAGACGVPSFEVIRPDGERRLLWGQDRMPMLAATLAGFWPSV